MEIIIILLFIICVAFVFMNILKSDRLAIMTIRADYWKSMFDVALEQRNDAEQKVERLLSLNKIRTPDEIIGD